MFAKLMKEIRLAAAVAAGVFGGLLAYRISTWAADHWLDTLTTDEQWNLFIMASVAAFLIVFCATLVWVFSITRARIRRVKQTRAAANLAPSH